MLALVLADRHMRRMVGQDIGRHQIGVDIEPGRGVLAVLARLLLELGHPVEPADAGDAVEYPGKPDMGVHLRLQKQDVPLGVDAAGEQHGRHLPRLAGEHRRLLPDR